MDRQEFKKAVDQIKKRSDDIDRLNECFSENGWDGILYPSDCSDLAISLLEQIMGDKAETISWWCWETNFGKDHPYVWDSNDVQYTLSTVDDLYEFLVLQQQWYKDAPAE